MTPPTPTNTHIWDGSRTLPGWLTGHRWTAAGQLVIRTPDGDTRPQAGWWLIAWSDGTITAASPTSGERVYGDGGMADQLARAEYELGQHAEAESADAAAGSYAGRVEELEAELARLRPQLARAQRIAMDILDDGPLERIRALPREPQIVHHIRIHGMPDQDAYNRGWSSAISAVHAALDTPPTATQATEPATSPLRDLIAAALYERERPPRDPHWPDAYAMDREVFEPMADAVLAALTQHLDIGEAQAWCKTCRRAWNSATHRCETNAERQAYQLSDVLRTLLSAEDAPTHCHTQPDVWDGGGPCVYCTALAAARTALAEEQP